MAYKRLHSEYKKLDKFLVDQLHIKLLIVYIWSVIVPIMMKLQGVYWTTSIIAIYLIMQQCSKLLVPYFRWLSLKKVYFWLICLDFIYAATSWTYFVNPELFLFCEAILACLFPILIEIFGINYNLYVVKKYSKSEYETIQYLNSMVFSVGGIAGYLTSMVAELIWNKQEYSMKMFCCMFIIILVFQVLNYRKNYMEMK